MMASFQQQQNQPINTNIPPPNFQTNVNNPSGTSKPMMSLMSLTVFGNKNFKTRFKAASKQKHF